MSDIKKSSERQESFPIIGLGGSAGSFDAMEKFFLHLPVDTGMAFIIVVHMDPSRNVNLANLLQPSTSMLIAEAVDGMLVEPNKVYVIPPNKDMGIHNRHLLLFDASRSKGAHMSIDNFFQSLAEDQWNHAVGIIFSGMGTDGETGIRMIKEKLGMAMVQEPETAAFRSMPETSIKTSLVDYVLPPEDMPVKLMQYLNHPALREPASEEFISERSNETHIRKILMLLRSHTGHDFTLYKKNTITRRIDRRIAFHQLPDYGHYVNFLRENPHEIEVLFNELLIGVTKFFRDREAFEMLSERLSTLLKSKGSHEPIRIWVAGCSTGEEAYSIAIILMEYLDSLKIKQSAKAQIFATDLDGNAIEHSRTGFYFSNIAADVSPERLERFFVKKNNGYQVKKEIREMIVFAQHNLIKDAPFTRLDLLCCRNVMIYLTLNLQNKIIPVFHYSLNVKGLLFLGPAESVGGGIDLFNGVDSKWKLFERKPGSSALGTKLDFPFHINNQQKYFKSEQPIKNTSKSVMAETFHKVLLDNYTPASLLLNEKGEILYINGKTGKYLHLHPGEAVMDIHRMAREELKYAVGNALHQAFVQRSKIEVTDARIKENGKIHRIAFTVEYLSDYPLNDLLLLTFEDKGPLRKTRAKGRKNGDPTRDGAVEELEKELIYTKQQLHTTIEQMETSLEELKSTNEELQSTNEELQSTNEEALTTKEEMQSLNEELMTINLQYQNKAEELSQLNNDMKNLLDNTEIGTIFLDNDLNILRYTPQVTKLFNVISSDVGRSITHIVSNFDYSSIEATILEVIQKLTGRELEVKTKKGDWYNMRIMPYRTMDNFISGAVLTFTRITPFKAMENRLHALAGYTGSILEREPDASIIVNQDNQILATNSKFLKMFGLRTFEVVEQSLMEIVHNQWSTNKYDDLLLSENIEDREIFVQHNYLGSGIKNLFVRKEVIDDKNKSADRLIRISFKEQ